MGFGEEKEVRNGKSRRSRRSRRSYLRTSRTMSTLKAILVLGLCRRGPRKKSSVGPCLCLRYV